MLEDVVIERATLAHLDAIVELERECFPTPWTRNAFARELARRDDVAVYVTASAGGETVGYAGMWVTPGEAHLCTIAVASPDRRRGIGERILVHMIDEAVRRGAERFVLEYRASNVAAQQLYAKYGFRRLGIRQNYYRDGPATEDAIVVSLDDIQEPEFAARLYQWKEAVGEPL